MPQLVTLIRAWGVREITSRQGEVIREGGLGAALRIASTTYMQVSLLDSDLTWIIDSMWVDGEVVHKHGFGCRDPKTQMWPLRSDIADALDAACIRRGLMEGGDALDTRLPRPMPAPTEGDAET